MYEHYIGPHAVFRYQNNPLIDQHCSKAKHVLNIRLAYIIYKIQSIQM